MAAHHVNQVAPNYVHSSFQSANKDDSFTFTVGKLDAGMAILIGDRASLIEFPSLLLPQGVTSGSVVNIRVLRNQAEELKQRTEFEQLQEDILSSFGTEAPQAPALRLRNVTQTSVTLEWDRLSLATANLLSLDIYRNGQRLAPIPNPLHNTSTKLSGLDVNAEYTFHLVLKTSAGTFSSPVIRTRTHTITDTSGISVCFGHVADPEILETAKEALSNMKAKWSDRIQIDTTHFICTDPRNPGDTNKGATGIGYNKAMQLSIPAVLPHWIFACHDQKKMVNISSYYLDQDPPNASTLRESINKIKGKPIPAPAPQEAVPSSQPAEEAKAAMAPEAQSEPPTADTTLNEGGDDDVSAQPPPPLEKSPKNPTPADLPAATEEAPIETATSQLKLDDDGDDTIDSNGKNKLGLTLTEDAPMAEPEVESDPIPAPMTPTISLTGPDETPGIPVHDDASTVQDEDEEEEEEEEEMDDISLSGGN